MEKNKSSNKISQKIGDTIERAGQKISDAGATRVGNAVYNTGDKVEHSGDNQRKPTSENP